jgi:hypothetical protein
MDGIGLALDVFIVAMTAWFWPHCAQPALARRRGSEVAQRIVLVATVLTIAAYATAVLISVAQIPVSGMWWVTTIIGVVWIVVVALGYFEGYRTLLYVTGAGRRTPR